MPRARQLRKEWSGRFADIENYCKFPNAFLFSGEDCRNLFSFLIGCKRDEDVPGFQDGARGDLADRSLPAAEPEIRDAKAGLKFERADGFSLGNRSRFHAERMHVESHEDRPCVRELAVIVSTFCEHYDSKFLHAGDDLRDLVIRKLVFFEGSGKNLESGFEFF